MSLCASVLRKAMRTSSPAFRRAPLRHKRSRRIAVRRFLGWLNRQQGAWVLAEQVLYSGQHAGQRPFRAERFGPLSQLLCDTVQILVLVSCRLPQQVGLALRAISDELGFEVERAAYEQRFDAFGQSIKS